MLHALKRRNFWVMLAADALLVSFAYYFSYFLRFDGNIPPHNLTNCLHTVIWITPLKLVSFFLFGLYKGMWRFTSIHELINLVKACLCSSLAVVFVLVIAVRFVGFPRSVFVIDLFLCFLLVGGFRLGIRLVFAKFHGKARLGVLRDRRQDLKKVLVLGAGATGEKLVRESTENPNISYDIVGFLDDDPKKLKSAIHGIPVLGGLDDLDKISGDTAVDEIIIAAPSATAKEMRRIVDKCEEAGLPFRTVPGIGELIEGRVSVSEVRNVIYEDLLGRREVHLNKEQIGEYIQNRRVLVTGGAGSIGSELCRQIAGFGPQRLIILDVNESSLNDIAVDLRAKFSGLKINSVLGPIQNKNVMENVFKEYEPEVVLHAAAYKHVPMMERHPSEAIYNNILGTMTLLDMCKKRDVERCVVVSTDKAVRPTNIMGASKRVCEVLTQSYAKEYRKRFMSVRFGNVIGSVGSVVPMFRKQIEKRREVTVTHPEITRYFMTIPEASQLILQAGAIGRGGEIFILKMGIPIRIDDMARDMIRLSGFEPEEDINIKYIGLRPGEKLYEELITEGEGVIETEHKDIMVLYGDNGTSVKDMNRYIKRLVNLAAEYDSEGIKKELKKVVPEYRPA